jgi:tetratricopeptide (TPR) repeat protein
MVTAPLLVLLYDRTFVAGTFWAAWRKRRRLYLGLACTWLPLACLVAEAGGRGGTAGFGAGIAWWAYAFTSARAIAHYLSLSVWPQPLVLDYGTSVVQHAAAVALPLSGLGLLAGATVLGLWRRPVPGFIGAWFFAILAPTSSVVPVASQTMAEHRMYLVLAAGLAAAVLGIYALAGRRSFVAFAFLAASFGLLTARRNEDYRSEIILWSDTVGKRPDNARAHYNLGVALGKAGREPEEVEQYEEALRLKPDYPDAHHNLANLLFHEGRRAEALLHCQAEARLRPKSAEANYNLAVVLDRMGQTTPAIRYYEAALHLQPDSADAHDNLGAALLQTGRVKEAIGHYQEALRLKPDYPEAHNNLGLALVQVGRMQEAVEHYQGALRLKPGFAEAHYNLGNVLFSLDRKTEAIGHYEEALRLKPDYAEAHGNLGSALLQTGRVAEAIMHYEAALRIRPDYADARDNLNRLRKLRPVPGP